MILCEIPNNRSFYWRLKPLLTNLNIRICDEKYFSKCREFEKFTIRLILDNLCLCVRNQNLIVENYDHIYLGISE